MRLRGFVPIEELATSTQERADDALPPSAPSRGARDLKPEPRPLLPDSIDDWEKRVSLFGEAEG
jgi:hypothetical protein